MINTNVLSGMKAIRNAALDAEISVITYVPGYPITEIANDLCAEISVNEKVALEIALGASATGNRAMVVVKQVGMNILADPLLISVTHMIGSGLVILVGDDLGPKKSQAEIDSRFYGLIFKIPVLDPSDPEILYFSIMEAFELSESLRIPVIVRITTRLLYSTCQPKQKRKVLKNTRARFDPSSWELTARGRHQRHHYEILPKAEIASEASSLNRVNKIGNLGIIASGFPAKIASDLHNSLLILGYVYPLPWKLIQDFIDVHEIILVAEEPDTCIESQLRANPKVKGKLTNLLPFGLLERPDIEKAFNALDIKLHIQNFENVMGRGYVSICENCPFSPLYNVIRNLGVFVAGDVGCIIKATREPYAAVDVVYGLGSSVAVASGFKKKGIAIIGDFAFAHTGIIGLINSIWKNRELVLIVVQNGIAATTGGQEAPDLSLLLKNMLPTICLDLPMDQDEIERIIKIELAKPAISAILAKGTCMNAQRPEIYSKQ
jgi:indolepyruvate ferredoxin oxidoreductase alpha subunit